MAEQEFDKEVVNALARALWSAEISTSNPSAPMEERKSQWKQNSNSYRKISRKALRRMTKAGYSIAKSA